MTTLRRPECFEFAMDFLGDPEEPEVRAYVEALESAVRELVALKPSHLLSGVTDEGPPGEGWKSDDLERLIRLLERLESAAVDLP